MAKKPSRKQRKVIREKHQRAQAHGLPARALKRPSKPAPADWGTDYSNRSHSEDADDERSGSDAGSPPKPPTLIERLKGLPVAAKLAAVAVLVVLAIGVIATLRRP
jgi:hypothetical protein